MEDERVKKQKEIMEVKDREAKMVEKLQSEIEKEKKDKRDKRQKEKDICMKIIQENEVQKEKTKVQK